MRVSCFCGVTWDAVSGTAFCPLCGEPVSLPTLGAVEIEEMKAALQEILSAHEGPGNSLENSS